jgi:hypothetical protein
MSTNSVFSFARVDPDSLEITLKYNTNGGAKWAEDDAPCEIPFDVLADQAVRADDGTISLVEDPAKVAQKTADQWTSVRAQQRQKLYESDWTCSVTDYEVPNKFAWVAYRADLRNVTTQTDPFAIVWPVEPVPGEANTVS